jgi:DNA repair exonuclease SbcCD ATPase subunit
MAKKKIYKVVEEQIELSSEEEQIIDDMRSQVDSALVKYDDAYNAFQKLVAELTELSDKLAALHEEYTEKVVAYTKAGNTKLAKSIDNRVLRDLEAKYDRLVSKAEELAENTTGAGHAEG